MKHFTIRDLKERTGEITRNAEQGRLSLITCNGKPLFVAVPFDEDALESGIKISLAAKLYQEEVLGLGKAAKVAGSSIEEFMETLRDGDFEHQL